MAHTSKKPLLPLFVLFILGLLFSLLFILPQKSKEDATLSFFKSSGNSQWDYQSGNVGELKTSIKADNGGGVVQVAAADATLELQLPFANGQITKPQANSISLASTNHQVTTTYTVTPNRVKEDIILHSPPTNTSGEKITFSIPLKTKNLDIYLNPENLPVFFDKNTGEYRFHIEKPYAIDKAGKKTFAVSYQLNHSGSNNPIIYPQAKGVQNLLGKLFKLDNHQQYVLTLVIDREWLTSKDRIYPVTIDPTITHDTQSEFTTGTLNRLKDTGAGDATPNLETYYQELGSDPYTVGLWHMDEAANDSCSGSADVCDLSGNGYHLTESGSSYNSGLLNNARTLNGSSSYLYLSSLPKFPQSTMTICAWIKTSDIEGNILYIGRSPSDADTELGFDIREGKAYIWDYDNGNGYQNFSISTINNNLWNHVCFVKNGTSGSLYINGDLDNTFTAAKNANLSTNDFIIGKDYRDNNNFLAGQIDELWISDIARTPEEIKAAASRRPSSVYTSPIIDTSNTNEWQQISWTPVGVSTGDGETASNSANLVAQWNFNESSGTNAASGGSCGSTCNGSLTSFTNTTGQDTLAGSGWTAANKRWGVGALMFDGSNDLVQITDNDQVSFTTNLTLEAWFKTSSNAASQPIIVKEQGGTLYPEYSIKVISGNVRGLINSANSDTNIKTVISPKKYNDGMWHHTASTYDGTNLKLYVDGILVATTATTITLWNSGAPLGIGRDPGVNTDYFSGVIDAARIYSRALPAAEILSNYNAGSISFQTRSSSNGTSWEAWKPTTMETSIDSMDNPLNWATPSGTIVSGALVTTSSATFPKSEGTNSLKLQLGQTTDLSNVIGLWHLDETGGTGAYLKDSSGNANHGTPTGSTLVSGVAGKARSVSGSSDAIAANLDHDPGTGNFTYETWIKTTQGTLGAVLNNWTGSGAEDVIGIYIEGTSWVGCSAQTNKIQFTIRDNGSTKCAFSTSNVNDNTWHYIAGVRSGDNVYLYFDGILQGSVSGASSYNLLPPASAIQMGAGNGFWATNTNIDEVRISSIARSAEEINESYRMGRDHRLSSTISSTDLSTDSKLPFYIASDRKGTFLELTAGESAFANYEPDANTVGLWHLEEQSGSGAYLKDSSGNGNHGTPTGTTYVQGKIGKNRNFASGSSQSVSVGSIALANNSFTLSAWTTRASTGATQYIFGQGSTSTDYGLHFGYTSTNYFRFGFYSDDLDSTTTYSDTNTWHYWVGTYDASTNSKKLYLDGQLINSNTANGDYQGTGTLTIGNAAWASSQYFNGNIDEVRIDNIARTTDEIRQAYEIGRRTHPITIDFKAALDSGNLIADSNDLAFTVDETVYGSSAKANHLFVGDKIIIKENYDGTEYLSQGEVSGVTSSTGAVTVTAWDSGSTFPTSGFTASATVFKWQREFMDLSGSLASHRNAITRLTYRITDGSLGANVWLDDLRKTSSYLSTPTGSTITSTSNRYFQYRAILSSANALVSSGFTSVSFNYDLAPTPTPSPTPAPIAPNLQQGLNLQGGSSLR